MKIKLLSVLLITASLMHTAFAFAVDSAASLTTTNDSVSQAASTIGSGAAIGNNTFNSVSVNPKQTPSALAANLTTSNDTCMGSSSAGAAAPGLSLSLGSTWTDTNCVRLKNSRELWNMGQHLASLAMMCSDPNNMIAIELANAVDPAAPHCPQVIITMKSNEAIAAAIISIDAANASIKKSTAIITPNTVKSANPTGLSTVPSQPAIFVKRAADGSVSMP